MMGLRGFLGGACSRLLYRRGALWDCLWTQDTSGQPRKKKRDRQAHGSGRRLTKPLEYERRL